MPEGNTARVRGEIFEFEDFAGYNFGVDMDSGAATLSIKFKVADPNQGLNMAKRLEEIRTKGISSASEGHQPISG